MKKIIALILAISLLTIAAFAEEKVIYFGKEYPVKEGYIITNELIGSGNIDVAATKELLGQEILTVPAEIDGHTVYFIHFSVDVPISEINVKEVILPETVTAVQSMEAPKLEKINLDNVKEVLSGAFRDCENLKYISENNVVPHLDCRVFQNTGLEYVTLLNRSLPTNYKSSNELYRAEENFMFCKELRTIYSSNERLVIGRKNFSDCPKLDYLCFDDHNVTLELNTFANCINLRTAMFYSGVSLVNMTGGYRWWDDRHLEPVFENCPKLTVIGKGWDWGYESLGSPISLKAYADVFDVKFIPAVIDYGEPSTVVAQAAQTATVTINGAAVPAYTVNDSVYVGESALKCLGFGMNWDGEARTTTVTKPENVHWSVELCTNPAPYSIDVVSSDVKFMLNGFPIPALNVGGGESIIDVNALAEAVLY